MCRMMTVNFITCQQAWTPGKLVGVEVVYIRYAAGEFAEFPNTTE